MSDQLNFAYKRFPSILFQFWMASLLAEMIGVSTFLISFFTSVATMDIFYDANIYHVFLAKESFFMILIFIVALGFFVPYRFLENLWGPYFDKLFYRNLLKIIGLVVILQIVHYVLPDNVFRLKLLILFVSSILWIRIIYMQSLFFYKSSFHSFKIPTTLSTFFITMMLSGLSLYVILLHEKISAYRIWFLLLLVLDLIIFTGALKAYKDASLFTRLTLKELFGRLFILTAIYMVAGLFIPVIYLIGEMFGLSINVQFLIPFILGGQIAKLFLFFIPAYALNEGDNHET